jgi:Glycosyl transferases group 1
MKDFHGYRIDTFDPLSYFAERSVNSWADVLQGRRKHSWWERLTNAEEVDRLYRQRDPVYMRLASDFVDRFRSHDLIVMATYNFLHPEILANELTQPIKVLGFVDDPHSTYIRGIPYLWAFDGAYYISPSYDERTLMTEALEGWGCEKHYWWPLVLPIDKPELTDRFFKDRAIDLVYVGAPKTDRLIKLKEHFGDRFKVHGRWPHRGYFGFTRVLVGRPLYHWRTTPLTEKEKVALFRRSKIGINLHLSDRPMETGNLRMYEAPAHGMMLLCDRGGRDAHEGIFRPDVEAVYYDSMSDAIEKAEHYLNHEDERIRIARAGCERVWRDYVWDDNLLRFLEWGMSLPRRRAVRRTMQS